MSSPILITTFQPWRAHQRSNSSDDLVEEMQKRGLMPPDAVWLRQLPVSYDLAPMRVKSEIMRLQPRVVICCGMAEKRLQLSVERQAKRMSQTHLTNASKAHNFVSKSALVEHDSILQTAIDVDGLIAGTLLSEVSEDAGTYVCNHLYYNVLMLVDKVSWKMSGVFIHIPVLNPDNKTFLLQDLLKIVTRLSANE